MSYLTSLCTDMIHKEPKAGKQTKAYSQPIQPAPKVLLIYKVRCQTNLHHPISQLAPCKMFTVHFQEIYCGIPSLLFENVQWSLHLS